MELVKPPFLLLCGMLSVSGTDELSQHPLAELLVTTATTAFSFSSLSAAIFFLKFSPPPGWELLESCFFHCTTPAGSCPLAHSNSPINVFWTCEERTMGVSHGPRFLLLRWHMIASHRVSAESWGPPCSCTPLYHDHPYPSAEKTLETQPTEADE